MSFFEKIANLKNPYLENTKKESKKDEIELKLEQLIEFHKRKEIERTYSDVGKHFFKDELRHSLQIANLFIEEYKALKQVLTYKKLFALLFVSQCWFRRVYNESLFDDLIVREYGLFSIRAYESKYRTCQDHGFNIDILSTDALGNVHSVTFEDKIMLLPFIREVIGVYKEYSGEQILHLLRTNHSPLTNSDEQFITEEDMLKGSL